jgi:hypothetical protein
MNRPARGQRAGENTNSPRFGPVAEIVEVEI